MRVLLIAILSFAFAGLSGCTMAPRYVRPPLPVQSDWPAYGQSVANGEKGAEASPTWLAFFSDPNIRALVQIALYNNRDLRVAMLNIEKVRAQYYIQRSALLPTINATGSASSQYMPKDMTVTRQAGISRQYSATVGFTAFELDLFGRIRSLKESALQQFFASEQAARSAQTSLVAEVANMYLQWTADKETLELARLTHQTRKDTYEMVRVQAEQGIASQLDLNQARTVLEDARVTLAQYMTRVAQDENAMALLLGTAIPAELTLPTKLGDVTSLPDLPAGLPSDLMQRRPDILGAEHQLKALNANIGAARANFFPSISITSAIGTITPQYNNLFSRGDGTWLFQPSAVLPIFDMGRNWATLKATETERDMAVAQYEKSIQVAFREVSDALAQRSTINEQLEAQTALVDAAAQTYELSLVRYETGIDSFMNVLDAQRTLFSAQRGLITTRLLREANTLSLYKALGGGWE